ncbi:hypothetical protein LTR94_026502 [Friedmanniomyces endolithicus]|nr:hypothetical protein LTR94_026502 [Friedmanniomyces endolithicus]
MAILAGQEWGTGLELLRRSPGFQDRPPPTSGTSPGSQSVLILPEPVTISLQPSADDTIGLRGEARQVAGIDLMRYAEAPERDRPRARPRSRADPPSAGPHPPP